MGIGSITFSLPHFLSGPYLLHGSDSNNATANICRAPKLLDQADRDTILQNLPGLDKIKSLTEGKYWNELIYHFACEYYVIVGTSAFNKWIVSKCLTKRSDMFGIVCKENLWKW